MWCLHLSRHNRHDNLDNRIPEPLNSGILFIKNEWSKDMAKRTKPRKTEAELLYNKQVQRINRFIRNAEKRGFRFDKTDILPQKPKKPTMASVRKLKALTPEKLYKKTTYMTDDGRVVTGYKGRQEERRKAARKGKQTRERNRERRQMVAGRTFSPPVVDVPRSEDIILANINSLISEYPTQGAFYLKKMLDEQINRWGCKQVAQAIANAPTDIVKLVQDIVYYEGDANATHRALRHMAEIISGEVLTDKQLEDIGEITDETDYSDWE